MEKHTIKIIYTHWPNVLLQHLEEDIRNIPKNINLLTIDLGKPQSYTFMHEHEVFRKVRDYLISIEDLPELTTLSFRSDGNIDIKIDIIKHFPYLKELNMQHEMSGKEFSNIIEAISGTQIENLSAYISINSDSHESEFHEITDIDSHGLKSLDLVLKNITEHDLDVILDKISKWSNLEEVTMWISDKLCICGDSEMVKDKLKNIDKVSVIPFEEIVRNRGLEAFIQACLTGEPGIRYSV